LAAISDARVPAVPRIGTRAVWLRWALVLLLACLPFELNTGFALAQLTFTNIELLALVVLGLWAVVLVGERRLPLVPRWLALGAGALLLIFLASALLAGPWRGASLKFTLRQFQGILLACCLADQLASAGWPLARRLVLALAVGAVVSAMLGLLELTEAAPVLALLALFKDQPTLAGGLLRLSATFGYANIAAMYYEAVLPLMLVATALAVRRRDQIGLSIGVLVLYVATLLTYSRAAFLTVNVAVAAIALAAFLMRSRLAGPAHGDRRVLVLCVAPLAISLGLLAFSPAFQTRIAEPDVNNWYRATYIVGAVPRLAPNQMIRVPVTVRNDGLVTWTTAGLRPIALAYHWLDARSRVVVRYNGRRTALPTAVGPGQMIRLDAAVQAPLTPGSYVLTWDMVVQDGGWFSERGNSVAELPVTVAGVPVTSQPAPAAEPANRPQRIVARPAPLARSLLWRGAITIWLTHPLLGIGPDVFRHVYGPLLGLREWDDRIHTNNLYLELLVGAGVLGLAAFGVLVAGALAAGRRVLAHPAAQLRWAAIGAMVALASFLLHGTLDMFLEYSATYMLLWMVIGALAALALLVPTD
jgi:hypothetical protein